MAKKTKTDPSKNKGGAMTPKPAPKQSTLPVQEKSHPQQCPAPK